MIFDEENLESLLLNKDLKAMIKFDNETGIIWLGQQRMLLLHTTAFGVLRSELINSFGNKYAKSLLMKMGHEAGHADATLSKSIRSGESAMDLFMSGPQLHSLEGMVSVKPVEVNLDSTSFYGEFIWGNSFEASEHVRLYGIAKEPVCWQLLGYADGFTSQLFEQPIHYKEVECVGRGDKHCRIIGKPLAEWNEDEQKEMAYSLQSLASKLKNLEEEVSDLRIEKYTSVSSQNIIADSTSIRDIINLLDKAASTNVTVLMLGETGVGKEVFSQYLHKIGDRKNNKFIAVNCASIPKDLVESELFGVDKGAFTGADKARKGRFERANGGTLFLDELGELNVESQAKLLRVIQTGELERVGGTEVISVNVRIIAATNANLLEAVKSGDFRADLYYRLNVFPIIIPPLRERLADIPGLVKKFIQKFNDKYGKSVTSITDNTLHRFNLYSWPGNIRELENIIERGVILTDKNAKIESTLICVGMPNLSSQSQNINTQGLIENNDEEKKECFDQPSYKNMCLQAISSGLSLNDVEDDLLKLALEQSGGNIEKTARLLKITGPQCRYRMKKINKLND
jgi:DNA-binding NtrC family response regulator/predicted hydrocarbon binding protein